MAKLCKRKYKLQKLQFYNQYGLPKGYGHLDRKYLDMNF